MAFSSVTDALRGKLERFAREAQISNVLNQLLDADVIAYADWEDVKDIPLERKKAEKIYEILHRRTFDNFTTFCSILRKNGGCDLANHLQYENAAGVNIPPSASAENKRLWKSCDDEHASKKTKLSESVGVECARWWANVPLAPQIPCPAEYSNLSEMLSHPVYGRLRDIIEPDFGFPEFLRVHSVIMNENYEQIIDEPDFCGRIRMLLELMCGKLNDAGIHLALKQSRQSHVSNYIFFKGSERSWPLTDQQQRLLTNPHLSDGLVLSEEFLDKLVSVDCISEKQRKAVKMVNSEERCRRFIRLLKRRSLADYIEFGECVKSMQSKDVYELLEHTKALADVQSKILSPTGEDNSGIEQAVVEQHTAKGLLSTVRDWVNSKLRGLPILSFIRATNSISWYFNCTSIDDVERLKEAYDSGELRVLLEDIVTHLSGSKNKIHLDVEWSNDDYTSCKKYVNSGLARLFERSLTDSMPDEVFETVLIKAVVLLYVESERASSFAFRGGGRDGRTRVAIDEDVDVKALIDVGTVCSKWWYILTGRWWNPITGRSRNGRLIRHTLNRYGRTVSKIWAVRDDIEKLIELKFGLLDELSKRLVLTPAQYEVIASAVNKENESETELWREFETVKESTKLLLLQTRVLSPAHYRQFKKALGYTHQQHVANVVIAGGGALLDAQFSFSRRKTTYLPLYEGVQDRIIVNCCQLVELLDTQNGLLDYMLATRCISPLHVQYIKSTTDRKQRNKRLLEVLRRRSQLDFYIALECLRRKQSSIVALFELPGVVAAKLVATIPPSGDETGHRLQLMTDPTAYQLGSLLGYPCSMGRIPCSIGLIGLERNFDNLVLYITCRSLDDVTNLSQSVADGNLMVVLSDLMAPSIGCELESLRWPVTDYNRCLHVLYCSENVYGKFYDFYGVNKRQCYHFDLAVNRNDVISSSTIENCTDDVLAVVLERAATLMFKWLLTLTAQAHVGSICIIRMVCRRWWKALSNRQLIRRVMTALCHPYRLNLKQSSAMSEPDQMIPLFVSHRLFGTTVLNNKVIAGVWYKDTGMLRLHVYDMSSSSIYQVELDGCSVRYPVDLVSCCDTNRLYIADTRCPCVWLVDCSTSVDSSKLNAVQFIKVEGFFPIRLSVVSQQLLVTFTDYGRNGLLHLCDVNGHRMRSVQLSYDVIDCVVDGALQTNCGTFYVYGLLSVSKAQKNYDTIRQFRILEVDCDGHVLRSCDAEVFKQSRSLPDKFHLDVDVDGRVFVVFNDDVLLLDSKLKVERMLQRLQSALKVTHHWRQAGQMVVLSYIEGIKLYHLKQ